MIGRLDCGRQGQMSHDSPLFLWKRLRRDRVGHEYTPSPARAPTHNAQARRVFNSKDTSWMSQPALLWNNAGRAPTLHSWIEIELEEVFEGYYVDRSFVVRTNCLDANGDNEVDSGFEHRF